MPALGSSERTRIVRSRCETASLNVVRRTTTGLRIKAVLDRNTYEKAIKVLDEELASLQLKPHRFHGDWNYTIHPTPS